MSKTFKSSLTDRMLEVEVYHDSPHIAITGAGLPHSGFFFKSTDAPALCLAILEAAGHEGSSSSSCLMQAFDLIEQHIKEESKKAEEAAALEKLTKRRVEVLGEISSGHLVNYSSAGRYVKNAVNRIIAADDRIIELEGEKAPW